jgi:hypothetical protein
MHIINLSAEPLNKLRGWLPRDLRAETVVFFPDACPGRAPLPTGTAVFTRQDDWRRFAVSDCGCGMVLARSDVSREDCDRSVWDALYADLKANKGHLGDLGSGGHFLDALEAYDDDVIYFLIHTGSRAESTAVDGLVDSPRQFDDTFARVRTWARDNRLKTADMVERRFGSLDILVHRDHNHYEVVGDAAIIRKGSVKLRCGETTVVPSNLDGDVVLVQATDAVDTVLQSMCDGTGRVMSRSDAKEVAESYSFTELRQRIYIPSAISDASFKTEAPFCYRDLDACLRLLDGFVVETRRFAPFAYLGQF